MSNIIDHKDELGFTLDDLPGMPLPRRVMMVDPEYFDVVYVINPYMEGNEGTVSTEAARQQWQELRNTFESLGLPVSVVDGQEGFPDMVFSANQSLPYETPDGQRIAIMSNMHSEHRQHEVPYIEQWYRQNGYEVRYLDESAPTFEGMGDAIWHTGRRLLWGGYGIRSSSEAYEQISDELDVPVITLQLITDDFYHLDTCFSILDPQSVLIYPAAFSTESLNLIHQFFPNVIEASEHEAKELFACNAACPDGKNVLIQQGAKEVNRQLTANGFVVHELDTSEFLKSGGSVYCMKMMLW